MKTSIKRSAILLIVFAGFITSLSAQQKVELPELSSKVQGPFTRFYVGLLQGKMDYEDYFSIRGTSVGLGLEAGQQVSSRLALYFDLGLLIMSNPTFSNTALSAKSVGVTQIGGGFAVFTGKGKTYFFADLNYTISTIVSSGSSSGSSKGGPGVNAGFGYDYNLFGRIDLGAAVYYHYSTMKDKPSAFGEPQITNNYIGSRINLRFGRK